MGIILIYIHLTSYAKLYIKWSRNYKFKIFLKILQILIQ